MEIGERIAYVHPKDSWQRTGVILAISGASVLVRYDENKEYPQWSFAELWCPTERLVLLSTNGDAARSIEN